MKQNYEAQGNWGEQWTLAMEAGYEGQLARVWGKQWKQELEASYEAKLQKLAMEET